VHSSDLLVHIMVDVSLLCIFVLLCILWHWSN